MDVVGVVGLGLGVLLVVCLVVVLLKGGDR
jgi:hypothetical protein